MPRRNAVPLTSQTIRFNWQPTEKQTPMVQSSAMFKLGGGARGGGKTDFLGAMGSAISLQFPGSRGFLGRRDHADFLNSTMEAFLRYLPRELCVDPCPNKQEKRFTIKTKKSLETGDPRWDSIVLYGELKDAGSILSGEINWFGIDEAFEVPQLSFSHLAGSLRHRLPDGTVPPYYGFLASNPSPGWLMDYFPVTEEEQALYQALTAQHGARWLPQAFPTPFNPDKVLDFDYAYFPFRAEDNPYLDPGYVARLIKTYEKEGPVVLARMVYGRWDMTMQGLVYRLLPAHRWNPKEPGQRLYQPGAPVILGIDPSNGAGHYAATVWQVFGRRKHVVAEFKKQGAIDGDFLDWLGAQPFNADIADAIVDSARPDSVKRLRAAGVPARDTGKKNVGEQVSALGHQLAIHPDTGHADILIDESQCPHLIREFGLYSYKDQGPNRLNVKEEPLKRDDDLINSAQYVCRAKWPVADALGGEAEYRTAHTRTPLYLARHNIIRNHR